jgi:Protein of unknown function (DUF2927)
MIRQSLIILATVLGGCASVPLEDTTTRARIADSSLPPMKVFGQPRPTAPIQSNSNIAADFLALHFQLESGRALPVFTRFETPITVKVTGKPTANLGPDLHQLLRRLRNEARIDIREINQGDANITIESVSRSDIRRALPQAACFVVPNVSSLAEFRRDRRKPKTNWALMRNRTQLAIFIPNDAAPQEVRDCLHEELAQAIGPLNDLYHLSDSVFNDDNVHTVLTGFDMLILRATYSPELYSGMTRAEVKAKLPSLLSRLNPAGVSAPTRQVKKTPRAWIEAVQTALGPGANAAARRAAANSAVRISSEQGWTDHRRAFSHYMLGRMIQTRDPLLAQQHYATGLHYLDQTPGTQLHRAYIITQTSAYSIATGDGAGALKQIAPALPVAQRSENASLLASLMLLQAEAYDLVGQPDKARSVRLDSLGWARYGFGSDWSVKAKMREIAALNPQGSTGG